MPNAYKSVMTSQGGGSGVPVDSLTVSKLPNKTFYLVGQDLNTDGLSIEASVLGLSGDVTSYCSLSPTTFNTMGNTTVTASLGGKSATFDVKVSENLGTLEETAWSDIQTIASMGLGDQYWAIGDLKTIYVNWPYEQYKHSGVVGNYKVYIIDFNYNGDNGIYFGCFGDDKKQYCIAKEGSATTDGTKSCNMNHWGDYTYGGWKGCDLRYDILGSTDVPPSDYGSVVTEGRVGYDATSTCATNPVNGTLMAALPSDLRAVIAPWTIYTDNVASGSSVETNITASVDYLPLLSESQVFSSITYGNSYEASHAPILSFYKNGKAVTKYVHNSVTTMGTWWLRSPAKSSTTRFVGVANRSERINLAVRYPYALAPAFRVA